MNKAEWEQYQIEKLKDRDYILLRCQTDLTYRQNVIEICRRDVKFFINTFGWTFDPRPDSKPNHLPFILYDVQEEYLDWRTAKYEAVEDGLTDKSRDMGVTWLVCAWDLHKWLFEDTFNALLGSRVEDLVDKLDDSSSLFFKIEYMLERLPEWLKPIGYEKDKHRKRMLFTNPANGNSIKGESSNAQFSRQGRFSVIDMDEFAFWDNAYSAWTATAEATRCRFPLSTPNGKGNCFSDLRFNSNIKRFSLRWDRHPLKDKAWYDKAKGRMRAKEFAQEVEIDYSASGGDLWLPSYMPNKDRIELKNPISPVPDEWYLWGSIDQHSHNPSSCHIYALDFDNNVYIVDERYQGESSVADVGDWFLLHPLRNRLKYVNADSALWAKDQEVSEGLTTTQISRADILQKRAFVGDGVKGEKGKVYAWDLVLVPGRHGNDLTARDMVIELIMNNKLFISPLCPSMKWELGEALHWKKQSESLAMSKNQTEILEDKNNHAWDEFKYWLTGFPQAPIRHVVEVVKDSMQWRADQKLREMSRKKVRDNG